jgi:Glycosyltransferase family 87
MTSPHQTRSETPLIRPLSTGIMLLACVVLMGGVALYMVWPAEKLPGPKALFDFQVFHIAGQLALAGDLATAYDAQRFWAHTRALTGNSAHMFWPYPPHVNLFTALLALLPLWLSYLVFCVCSLLFYTLTLRRLAGVHYGMVLLMLLPSLLLCILIGQNAVLIGALVGWLASLALAGRTLAGVPLGLLTVKPQFLPGIGLYLLLRGHWRIIFTGALVAGLALAAATLVFGLRVWPDFLAVMGNVSAHLFEGRYQYFRMPSLFAALFVATRDPQLAMAAQIGLVVVLAGSLLLASRRGWPPRQLLAAAIMSSTLMSPYGYDYDLPVLGAAIALLMPDLVRQDRRNWVGLLLLAWLACVTGTLTKLALVPPLPAVQFVPVLLLCAALLVLARKASVESD